MVTWMECWRRAAACLSFTEGAGFLPLSTETRGRCARLWLMPPAMLQQVEKYRIRRRRSRLLLDRVPLQTSLRQILRSGKYLANIADKLPHIKYKAVWNHFCKCFNEMINERRVAAIITGGNMSTLLLDVLNFTPLHCKKMVTCNLYLYFYLI